MIERIYLRNWKTHGATSLEFQKGTNVLIGVMGAGKSSVLDAISFALFGTFPALTSKRVTLAGLVKNRPKQEEEAEVRMQFTAGDDAYTVTRKITGNGTVAKLEKNGAHMQTQPTKVTEEIESALKLDYDTFSRVVYAEQNRLDYFLDLRQGERKKQIDHMLGLDLFATAEENSTSLINDIRSGIKNEEELLARPEVKAARESLLASEKEKSTLEEALDKLQKRAREEKANSEEASRKFDELKRLKASKEQTQREIAAQKSRAETLAEQIREIALLKLDGEKLSSEKKETERQITELTESIEDFRKREREQSKSTGELESRIKQNEKMKKERQGLLAEMKGHSIEEVKARLKNVSDDLQRLSDLVSSKKGRSEEIKEIIKELSRHVGRCPVCERELEGQLRDRLLKDKSLLLKELEGDIEKHGRAAREANDELKRIKELHDHLIVAEGKLAQYKDIDAQIEKDQKALDRLKEELASSREKTESMTKKQRDATARLAKLEAGLKEVARSGELVKEMDKAESDIRAAEAKLKKFDVDENKVDEAQKLSEKYSNALAATTSELVSSGKMLEKTASEIKEKAALVSQYETMERRIERKRSLVGNLNKFKSALIDTEAQLRNRLVSSINSHMQGLWPQLYPYNDYPGIRLNATKDDYSLEVNTSIEEGEESWSPVEGIASGGERSVACLSMRVALAMVVVPNLRWLILDEPTHNIDASGISKLIETLSGPLPELVDQIFIITHEEELKQIPGTVYVLGRNKAANAPTEVSGA